MNGGQQILLPRFEGKPDNFVFWSAYVTVILEAKRVWRDVRSDRAGSSMLHRAETSSIEAGAGGIMAEESARDVACSLILRGRREVLFLCVMAHQDDLQKMWELLH